MQIKYASGLISSAALTDNMTVYTPHELNSKLNTIDGDLANVAQYQQLVRNLIYLIITNLDVNHVVHVSNQIMAAPQSIHYSAALQILRCIDGTL